MVDRTLLHEMNYHKSIKIIHINTHTDSKTQQYQQYQIKHMWFTVQFEYTPEDKHRYILTMVLQLNECLKQKPNSWNVWVR